LPLRSLGWRALPYETLALAFTPRLIADVYVRGEELLLPDASAVLDAAGYVAGNHYRTGGLFPAPDEDGRWWLPSGRVFHAPSGSATPLQEALDHFFLPRRFQ